MCVWGGCIGEDPFGDFLLQTLEESGVQTTGVITDGAHGSYVMGDGLRLRCDAYPTAFRGGKGAGDAFVAGIIAGHLNGEELCGCVRSTSATASVIRKKKLSASWEITPFTSMRSDSSTTSGGHINLQ